MNYRQGPNGFTNSPDQIIPLPPQTVWAALCDVDAHPGLELLMSTATGLVYSRQNAGLFESERHTLFEASQVFTNFDYPILTVLNTNKARTNDSIPVISQRQAMLYHRNSAYEWSPGPPLTLEGNTHDLVRRPRPVEQTLGHWGQIPRTSLHFYQSLRAKAEPKRDKEPENDTIRKIMDDMKKGGKANPPQIGRVDVDGDGREDLVLWQLTGNPALKTDIYIFLRGADQQLPERPTQVLHCRGIPIPFGPSDEWSPVHDLNGDGVCELVLLEFRTSAISAGGLLEILLSHGIDWALTVRTFQHGAFSGSPDASVPVKGILPSEIVDGWSYSIQGDFNGDGRPDLLVRRSETQWNIYFSTTDGTWFAAQPAMTFDTPSQGYMEINDVNGDGLSDIIWHEPDKHRFSIFMLPSHQPKDTKP